MIRPPAVERALQFIENPAPGQFENTALDVYVYQFERNQPYRRFCRSLGKTPDSVKQWSEIPALPTAAFKEAILTTAPPHHVFETSGTTGKTKRGCHYLPELALYQAAWVGPFQTHVLPDTDRARILSLIPGSSSLPRSSLSFMASEILDRFGSEESGVFMDLGGLDRSGLDTAVQKAVSAGEPVLILGTAFALVEWLDTLSASGNACALPAGSRIMDTGGFKARSREVTRSELHDLYRSCLGVPESHVVGEYGMTELCSQFYERTLLDSGTRTGTYFGPPWTRTLVLDPGTLQPVGPGEAGLLAHWDLANAWSVLAVLTEDLGLQEGDGFRVLGRAGGAELRGCSLTTETILDD